MNFEDLIGLLILLIYMAAFFRRAKKEGEKKAEKKDKKPRRRNLGRIISWLNSRFGKPEERLTAEIKKRSGKKAPAPDTPQRKEQEDATLNGATEKSQSPLKEGPLSFLELLLYEEPETSPPLDKKAETPLEGILDAAYLLKDTAVTGEVEIPSVAEAPSPLKEEPAARKEISPAKGRGIAGTIKRRPKGRYPAKELKKAIIWSEILGPPRALKGKKRRPS